MRPPPFCVHRNRRQNNNENNYQTAIAGINPIIYSNQLNFKNNNKEEYND